VVTILAFLAVIAFPSYVHARANSEKSACLNNLRQIDEAKQQWALENNRPSCAAPANTDIAPYMKNRSMPTCPSSGNYSIGNICVPPTCSVVGHVN
jgi:type II secretory pathway pseudopilin PulG